MSEAYARSVGKLFQILSIFSLKKSLIEAILASESPNGNHPHTLLFSTGLSDYGLDMLPLLIEHWLMNYQLGSYQLPTSFRLRHFVFANDGVYHGALGLITSLIFLMGACLSKSSLSWSLH